MMIGIYIIKNTENQKVYVGSSRNIKQRIRVHKHRLKYNKHHSAHLQKSYEQNPEKFIFEVIEIVEDITILEIREQYWVDKFQSFKSEYGYNAVRVVSQIDPQRMRERWAKPGEKEKQSDRMKKICNSESWKANTKAARQNLKLNPEKLEEYSKVRLLTSPHRKKVKCVQTGEIFESIAQAAKKLNVSLVKIRDSANKKRPSRGYSFEWINNE